MKKIIKLIVLLNIIGLNAQESIKYSLKINYDIYFNTELPNKKKGTLFIDNDFSKSIFIYGKNKGKSIEENNEEKTLNLKYAESERFNYFNSINDSLYSKEKIITNEFIIAEKAENLNWFLSSETKKIDNLTVKKATLKFRGRNYIAWYSMDYPLNFGPWKFNKLPGLILEIYDENQRYRWVVNSIKKIEISEKINLTELLSNQKKISIRDYVDMRYNQDLQILNKSRLPRGTIVTKRKIKRNGIEIKFKWEED